MTRAKDRHREKETPGIEDLFKQGKPLSYRQVAAASGLPFKQAVAAVNVLVRDEKIVFSGLPGLFVWVPPEKRIDPTFRQEPLAKLYGAMGGMKKRGEKE